MHNKTLNERINRSYDIDKHYDTWSNYREELSKFISSLNLIDQRVLVVGAGNCNDIDLSIFNQSDTTLLDIDKEAMINGIDRQGLSKNNFKLIEIDLLQLPDEFFSDFEVAVKENRLADILKHEKLVYDIGDFDIIVILPIYTQFILPQILPLIASDEQLIGEVMNFIGNRIVSVNEELRKHLSNDGQVCVITDVLEYEMSSEEGQYLKAHTNHDIILAQHFESYLMSYGHGLGSYGQFEMLNSFRAISEKYFVWSFSENRLLLVKGETGKK